MKVHISREPGDGGGQVIVFTFELESEDAKESVSTNAGQAPIKLGASTARFYFPVEFALPHPDLCALAALKIISPYVGHRLRLDQPCSSAMSQAITATYPRIREVFADPEVTPRSKPSTERPAVSFSGGADSVAAASLLPEGTPLLLSARAWHPGIGKFEPWYNTEANIETLKCMPERFRKFVIKSDFEFLSTNGNYCIYPDSYAFTIPCILMADALGLSHIVTGDIWAAFTLDETKYLGTLFSNHERMFEAAGLSLEPVLNGVGELGSLLIADAFGMLRYATTCQYGQFQRPCMRCIKCFRKAIYAWALFDRGIDPKRIAAFNEAPAVRKFAAETSARRWAFAPTYKHSFLRIHSVFDGAVGEIRARSLTSEVPFRFADKVFSQAYKERERPAFSYQALDQLLQIMELMPESEQIEFQGLNSETYAA